MKPGVTINEENFFLPLSNFSHHQFHCYHFKMSFQTKIFELLHFARSRHFTESKKMAMTKSNGEEKGKIDNNFSSFPIFTSIKCFKICVRWSRKFNFRNYVLKIFEEGSKARKRVSIICENFVRKSFRKFTFESKQKTLCLIVFNFN